MHKRKMPKNATKKDLTQRSGIHTMQSAHTCVCWNKNKNKNSGKKATQFSSRILNCELWGVKYSSLLRKAEHDNFRDRIKQLWTFSSHWWTSLKTGDIPFMRMPMWPLPGWRWERMSWFIALPGLTGRPTFFIHPSSIYMTVDGATPALADCPAMSFVFVYWHSRKWWPSIRGGTL